MTGAIADCERVIHAFWGQPVNTITTLAFVGSGVIVWRRTDRRWLAAALAATGIGSFVFHGPMPPGAQWMHDVTLAWLLAVAGGRGTAIERWTTWPALAALGVGFAVVPASADITAVGASVAAIGSILLRDRSPRTIGAMALLAGSAIVGRLSATGGPLCNPDSLLQGHGLWHVGAAAAVALWATSDAAAGPSA